MISQQDLYRVKAYIAKATKGPWRWGDWSTTFGSKEGCRDTLEWHPTASDEENIIRLSDEEPQKILSVVDDDVTDADKKFIASARTDLPKLVEEVEAQAKRIAKLEGRLRDYGCATGEGNLVEQYIQQALQHEGEP